MFSPVAFAQAFKPKELSDWKQTTQTQMELDQNILAEKKQTGQSGNQSIQLNR